MRRIFLSHNEHDKPVVEPVALKLREIFGQDNVFYDSWSLQPGDGIIAGMNAGLEGPDFVFYFVSANSLKSKMVDLEWQTALYKATKGQTKLIAVRVDGSAMPAILMQNVYIDMFTHGITYAVNQIVNVCQGNNVFSPQHRDFQNLTYRVERLSKSEIMIHISALHLLEADVGFAILSSHKHSDVSVVPQVVGACAHAESTMVAEGKTFNSWLFEPVGFTITPRRPLSVLVKNTTDEDLNICHVMHREGSDRYVGVALG